MVGVVKCEPSATGSHEEQEPPPKRTKTLTLEEYEAALDQDFAYDELDFPAEDMRPKS